MANRSRFVGGTRLALGRYQQQQQHYQRRFESTEASADTSTKTSADAPVPGAKLNLFAMFEALCQKNAKEMSEARSNGQPEPTAEQLEILDQPTTPHMVTRGDAGLLPHALMVTKEDLGPHKFESYHLGELNYKEPAPDVRSAMWHLFVSSVWRLRRDVARKPKRSVIHWMILNAISKAELDMIERLHVEWRMMTAPLSQATTNIWADACIRLDYPELFMKIILDRWKYRSLPISYTLSRFIGFLGFKSTKTYALAKETEDEAKKKELEEQGAQYLDDAFRLFALYPYYEVPYDPQGYGALVEACCMINTEEAWRRALVVSEEGLAATPKPLITVEALEALVNCSTLREEAEMAARYKSILADTKDLPTAFKRHAQFDKQGVVVDQINWLATDKIRVKI
ncbi:hypothetical protein GGH99_001560 [Coemansia sp. RSA 1285]|nr:hypothetical protein EV177_007674 [Coemansia sp. RSA 1804]KAJ2692697.1 hypothetical protein GGH99_001560 [Coemansia sp. RSA 1285]